MRVERSRGDSEAGGCAGVRVCRCSVVRTQSEKIKKEPILKELFVKNQEENQKLKFLVHGAYTNTSL